MALPAHLLEQLPREILSKIQQDTGSSSSRVEVLPLGVSGLEAVLEGGGLPRGGVVELAVQSEGSLGVSLGLAACRSAQRESLARGAREAAWCAFVDGEGTLHAPGVAAAGVALERLLVVRAGGAGAQAVARAAVRLVESRAFAVVVVDTLAHGGGGPVSLAAWPRVVRRLAASAAESHTCVVLVTDAASHRPLPLPVAQRIELARSAPERLVVRVAKDRRGRVSAPHAVPWAAGALAAPSVAARPSLAPVRRASSRGGRAAAGRAGEPRPAAWSGAGARSTAGG
ncbi:MAG: recombinase A [Polyangiaceae bacterium]|nr:recombinase A [Polyangiaceae bacterium]